MLLVERDSSAARALVAKHQRERALLALRKKRLHEQQLDRLDAWLLNVEGLVSERAQGVACRVPLLSQSPLLRARLPAACQLANMESVTQQHTVFKALAQGTQELKQLQQARCQGRLIACLLEGPGNGGHLVGLLSFWPACRS